MSFIIAIDGPAGSGKSTIARALGERLGITRVDTGAIYRALTLAALRAGGVEEAEALMPALSLSFSSSGAVHLGAEDVSEAIRQPEISARVSEVAARPAVRAGLLGLQRRLALADPVGAVMEGRDIGTVVFPDAPLKVFLTASEAERARRRAIDLRAAGAQVQEAEVQEALRVRDEKDSSRAVAPLVAAADAVELDSTGLSREQVVDRIAALAEERGFSLS